VPVHAQPAQRLVPEQSVITFVSRQMGVPVEGSFGRFDGQIAFDAKQPERSRIGVTVDLASVKIGDDTTSAELRKPGWFDTAKYPQASFVSGTVKALGGNRYQVAGQFSLKGRTQPITLAVTLRPQGALTFAEGGFTLKRLDWRIGDGEWNDVSLVANEVDVKFRLALSGLAP
jgi:polyisoprenoid-binding protein YceI